MVRGLVISFAALHSLKRSPSGKSTQVPAFILEEQLSRGLHCKIFCTEPRRISAISLAQRVSLELGDAPGQVGTNASMVGYSIRLESNTSRNTRLAYVTNGIALRMLEAGSGVGGKGTGFDEITVRVSILSSRLRLIYYLYSISSSMK
jgi:ATP-dependent RNA helicase DHX29